VIIQNDDYGISAEVTQTPNGWWKVTLRDDDTGETVGPSVRLFNLKADALKFAEKLCA
jgi:hypothetical protein